MLALIFCLVKFIVTYSLFSLFILYFWTTLVSAIQLTPTSNAQPLDPSIKNMVIGKLLGDGSVRKGKSGCSLVVGHGI